MPIVVPILLMLPLIIFGLITCPIFTLELVVACSCLVGFVLGFVMLLD